MAILESAISKQAGLLIPASSGSTLPDIKIELYSCTGATGVPTRVLKEILDVSVKELSFDYCEQGGYGSFAMTLGGGFSTYGTDCQLNQWEIDIKVDDELKYRGFIQGWYKESVGTELTTEIEGSGYAADLRRVHLNLTYTATSITDILSDIIQTYIDSNTRIVWDPTLVSSTYTPGTIKFDCSAYDAIKLLAELEGSTAWGVDYDRLFYFTSRVNSALSCYCVFMGNNVAYTKPGFFSTKAYNQITVVGGIDGSGTQIRAVSPDATSVAARGLQEVTVSRPDFLTSADAQRWADNWVALYKNGLNYSNIKLNPLLSANFPPSGGAHDMNVNIGNVKVFDTSAGNLELPIFSIQHHRSIINGYKIEARIIAGYPPETLEALLIKSQESDKRSVAETTGISSALSSGVDASVISWIV